ncbi:MAG TPA: LuxR C-terminal-related transcriptional regulator, partial [Streptosporangiaceae bacterium]
GVAAWRHGDLDQATVLQLRSLRQWEGLNERMGPTYCLEALSWIAASQGQPERAAILVGAAASLWQSMGTTVDGYHHLAGYHQDCERQTRQALGEAAFEEAYHRGMQLAPAYTVAYALRQPERPPVPAVPAEMPLTPRELQVARLIATGHSNKQIAADLVISQRTAEGHVEHILTKLGFTSRAQVAVWITAPPEGTGS